MENQISVLAYLHTCIVLRHAILLLNDANVQMCVWRCSDRADQAAGERKLATSVFAWKEATRWVWRASWKNYNGLVMPVCCTGIDAGIWQDTEDDAGKREEF